MRTGSEFEAKKRRSSSRNGFEFEEDDGNFLYNSYDRGEAKENAPEYSQRKVSLFDMGGSFNFGEPKKRKDTMFEAQENLKSS